jgi:hypothetical protein
MNRRERRSASSKGQPVPPRPQTPNDLASSPSSGSHIEFIDLPITQNDTQPSKPSWLLRVVSRVMLSRWVRARVQNPEVERLLISIARETGRMDVADELMRRQGNKLR